MMESTPYITPADPLPATSSIVQSQIPQIPLVQSTQILQPTQVVTSQVVPVSSIVQSTPVPQYVPVVSTIQQANPQPVHSGVKVVPIYDNF